FPQRSHVVVHEIASFSRQHIYHNLRRKASKLFSVSNGSMVLHAHGGTGVFLMVVRLVTHGNFLLSALL
ncbi:MAG: hypothetical protein RR336_11130, partial [Oscillospiraceae bacterium]